MESLMIAPEHSLNVTGIIVEFVKIFMMTSISCLAGIYAGQQVVEIGQVMCMIPLTPAVHPNHFIARVGQFVFFCQPSLKWHQALTRPKFVRGLIRPTA